MDLALTTAGFWDVDFNKMNSEEHADFIIARVFQYGLIQDLKIVVKHYTAAQIKHAIEHTRGMDPHAKALAELFAK